MEAGSVGRNITCCSVEDDFVAHLQRFVRSLHHWDWRPPNWSFRGVERRSAIGIRFSGPCLETVFS